MFWLQLSFVLLLCVTLVHATPTPTLPPSSTQGVVLAGLGSQITGNLFLSPSPAPFALSPSVSLNAYRSASATVLGTSFNYTQGKICAQTKFLAFVTCPFAYEYNQGSDITAQLITVMNKNDVPYASQFYGTNYNYVAAAAFSMLPLNGDCITCSVSSWALPTASPTFTTSTIENYFGAADMTAIYDSYIYLTPTNNVVLSPTNSFLTLGNSFFQVTEQVGTGLTFTSDAIQVGTTGKIQCIAGLSTTIFNFSTSLTSVSASLTLYYNNAFAALNQFGSSFFGEPTLTNLIYNYTRSGNVLSYFGDVTSGGNLILTYDDSRFYQGVQIPIQANASLAYMFCGILKTSASYLYVSGFANTAIIPSTAPTVSGGTNISPSFLGPTLSPSFNTPSITRTPTGALSVSTQKFFLICSYVVPLFFPPVGDNPPVIQATMTFWLNYGSSVDLNSRINFVEIPITSVGYTHYCSLQKLNPGTYNYYFAQNIYPSGFYSAAGNFFYFIEVPIDITSSPSASPTTSKPSQSPTTSKPSQSPTTSKPSKSPTTSKPSQTPSRTPSRAPQASCQASRPVNG